MILTKEQLHNSEFTDTLVNSYNTSMIIAQAVAEKGVTLNERDKQYILDSVGALLEALGVTEFTGTFTYDDLKNLLKDGTLENIYGKERG